MTYIEITVNGQTLINKQSQYALIAGSKGLYGIKFNFSSLWNGISAKYVQLSKEGVTSNQFVITDSEPKIAIPDSFVEQPGIITVTVYGGDRITTTTAAVQVLSSGYDGDVVAHTEPAIANAVPVCSYEGNNNIRLITKNGAYIDNEQMAIPEHLTYSKSGADAAFIPNRAGVIDTSYIQNGAITRAKCDGAFTFPKIAFSVTISSSDWDVTSKTYTDETLSHNLSGMIIASSAQTTYADRNCNPRFFMLDTMGRPSFVCNSTPTGDVIIHIIAF